MLAQLILLGTGLSHTLAQDTFNCAKFWPSTTPGLGGTLDTECRMYPGYPQAFGPTTVSVIYTNDWTGNLGVVDASLKKAITESVGIYSSLGPVPDMVIMLGKPSEDDTGFPTYPDGPCLIRSFEGWDMDESVALSPSAMQAVAQEIFHCLQETELGDRDRPANSPSEWVLESSADYFSNLVFRDADLEWSSSVKYRPDVPIWRQTNSANLWFQALEGRRGPVYLHEFVKSTEFAASEGGERARLANYAAFADDFYLFAKNFASRNIRDTNGTLIPLRNSAVGRPIRWTLNEKESEGSIVLRTVPFTISQFTTTLEPGQIVKLYSSAKGKQRVAWHLQSDKHWNDVPSGSSTTGSEGVINIPCGSHPATIHALFISTENKATDRVNLKFVQQYKDENCDPTNSEPGPTSTEPEEPEPSTATSETSSVPEPTNTENEPTGSATGPTSSVPEPTGTGSCSDSDIPMDPCLLKNDWGLDIPSTETLMRKHLSSLPEVTINGVKVTGAGSLTFNDTSSSWTYTGLTTDVDITAEGMKLPVSVKIDGKTTGLFFIKLGGKGSGKACLAWRTGSGKATAQLPFVGEQVFDLAPGGGYFFDMDVEYTCGGGRMTIVSGASGDIMAGGSPGWGPFAYNAA